MTELAGKFAGVVLVRMPDDGVAGLTSALEAIEVKGLLHVSAEEAGPTAPEETGAGARLVLDLIGQDHTGIVHEVSHALASRNVSIEELETEVVPAPMEGKLFKARAILQPPSGMEVDDVQVILEDLAHDLMVDLDVHDESGD